MLDAHLTSQGAGAIDLPPWTFAYVVFAALILMITWSRSRYIRHPVRIDSAPSTPSDDDAPGGSRRAPVVAAQVLTSATWIASTAIAWFGPRWGAQNIASSAVRTTWLGGAVVSIAFGPIWNLVGPFCLAERIGRRRRSGQPEPVAPWWSPVPAYASILIVLVAWGDGYEPRNLAIWLTAYGIGMGCVAVIGGRRALARWDAFGATLDLAGCITRPRRSLADARSSIDRRRIGLLAALIMGCVATDQVMGRGWFARSIEPRGDLVTVIVALGAFTTSTGAILAAWTLAERLVERARAKPGSRPLAPALAPAATSVFVAHGFTVGLTAAQNLAVLASDPLARGWNLFGTVYWEVSEQPISALTAGMTQSLVILAGHLVAISATVRAATAAADGEATSAGLRHRAWRAALPAMGLVVLSGVVWTLLLLGW